MSRGARLSAPEWHVGWTRRCRAGCLVLLVCHALWFPARKWTGDSTPHPGGQVVSAGKSACGGRSSPSWKWTARQTRCDSISSAVSRRKPPASLIVCDALTWAGAWQLSPPTGLPPTAHVRKQHKLSEGALLLLRPSCKLSSAQKRCKLLTSETCQGVRALCNKWVDYCFHKSSPRGRNGKGRLRQRQAADADGVSPWHPRLLECLQRNPTPAQQGSRANQTLHRTPCS